MSAYLLTPSARLVGKFLPAFVLVSLMATLLHEYLHIVILRALGGEGIVSFGLGLLIFPWDESHVFPSKMPPGLAEQLLFSGLPAAITAAMLYFLGRSVSTKDAQWIFWLAMWPQITWTFAEPALWYAKITAPRVVASVWLPPSVSYHALLFLSWGIAVLTLKGRNRRPLVNRL